MGAALIFPSLPDANVRTEVQLMGEIMEKPGFLAKDTPERRRMEAAILTIA